MEKEAERQKIKSEEGKDTANRVFTKILEKRKKKNITEISILEPLYGSLNLAILSEQGFMQVEVLRFVPGKLLAITNIPSTIRKLYLSDQLLDKIDLPDSIEYIDIDHNLLSKEWDLSRYSLLRYVNAAYNNIKSLGKNLPESLEELYCTHNHLRHLFLAGCPRLRILHCNYNDKLTIHDVPDTLVDTQFPEKVKQVVDSLETSKKVESKSGESGNLTVEYEESIRKYFEIKSKYESDLFKIRKNKRKVLPKCIGCNRAVGMFFSGKDYKYTAYCGSTNSPCEWRIVIHRGEFYPLRETMQEMISNLEDTKQNIIIQKMDTLFNYISDDKSAALFKEQLDFYKTNSELVYKYRTKYHYLYFDEEKREIITLKKKQIEMKLMEMREYLENDNRAEAIRIQYEEIQPLAKYIQSLTYPHMEMTYFNANEEEEWHYEPSQIILSQYEINHEEHPSVEQFGKRSK